MAPRSPFLMVFTTVQMKKARKLLSHRFQKKGNLAEEFYDSPKWT
jgi:hypothetical protein